MRSPAPRPLEEERGAAVLPGRPWGPVRDPSRTSSRRCLRGFAGPLEGFAVRREIGGAQDNLYNRIAMAPTGPGAGGAARFPYALQRPETPMSVIVPTEPGFRPSTCIPSPPTAAPAGGSCHRPRQGSPGTPAGSFPARVLPFGSWRRTLRGPSPEGCLRCVVPARPRGPLRPAGPASPTALGSRRWPFSPRVWRTVSRPPRKGSIKGLLPGTPLPGTPCRPPFRPSPERLCRHVPPGPFAGPPPRPPARPSPGTRQGPSRKVFGRGPRRACLPRPPPRVGAPLGPLREGMVRRRR